MLHLIWSVLVGFFVGLIARAILPGVDQMGFMPPRSLASSAR
jgi:uncharacterized membrane protein YeaQ/YmgE (transglycosylase-associated protein family)